MCTLLFLYSKQHLNRLNHSTIKMKFFNYPSIEFQLVSNQTIHKNQSIQTNKSKSRQLINWIVVNHQSSMLLDNAKTRPGSRSVATILLLMSYPISYVALFPTRASTAKFITNKLESSICSGCAPMNDLLANITFLKIQI